MYPRPSTASCNPNNNLTASLLHISTATRLIQISAVQDVDGGGKWCDDGLAIRITSSRRWFFGAKRWGFLGCHRNPWYRSERSSLVWSDLVSCLGVFHILQPQSQFHDCLFDFVDLWCLVVWWLVVVTGGGQRSVCGGYGGWLVVVVPLGVELVAACASVWTFFCCLVAVCAGGNGCCDFSPPCFGRS